LKTSRMEL